MVFAHSCTSYYIQNTNMIWFFDVYRNIWYKVSLQSAKNFNCKQLYIILFWLKIPEYALLYQIDGKLQLQVTCGIRFQIPSYLQNDRKEGLISIWCMHDYSL